MLALTEGLLLYHGSYTEVCNIDLCRCAPGKDFGQGFYLTTDYDQAKSFVSLSARKHKAETGEQTTGGFVSRFRVTQPNKLGFHAFKDADGDWLHFVAANRRAGLFPHLAPLYDQFDVVAGKIANDQTARTLQLYVAGAFGAPGTDAADSLAIAALMPNRLSDQFCFRTEQSIRCLAFEGSDRCDR